MTGFKKNIGLLFGLFMLLGISNMAFGQGIEFHHGTWDEAKTLAKEQNKLIFVDAYAVWCGPCRRMAATSFKDKAVGDYFNEHFVNVKMDMEKGEGRALSRTWGIRAYPTLIFFNSEGKEVKRVLGARDANGLLEFAKSAMGS